MTFRLLRGDQPMTLDQAIQRLNRTFRPSSSDPNIAMSEYMRDLSRLANSHGYGMLYDYEKLGTHAICP